MTQKVSNTTKSIMLDEIKKYLNMHKNSDFARFLGISSQAVSNWYTRNTFDSELLYTKCDFINPDWLLTGRGSMLKSESMSPMIEQVPAPTPQPTTEAAIYYNMYKEEKAENKELIEQIGVLKQTIRQLEEKVEELQHELTVIASGEEAVRDVGFAGVG